MGEACESEFLNRLYRFLYRYGRFFLRKNGAVGERYFFDKKQLTKCIYGGINVYIRYIQYDTTDRGDRLNIIISNSNGKPIYEQITTQIKNAIIGGELLAGDPLPSMRGLAKELRISVITTKRAYEDLEREGFIVTVVGKGSFVAEKNMEFVRENQLRKVEESIQKAVADARAGGITLGELIDMLSIIYQEE